MASSERFRLDDATQRALELALAAEGGSPVILDPELVVAVKLREMLGPYQPLNALAQIVQREEAQRHDNPNDPKR